MSGFHNWLSFRKEEVDGDLNYMGYMKIVDLKGKVSDNIPPSITKHHFFMPVFSWKFERIIIAFLLVAMIFCSHNKILHKVSF